MAADFELTPDTRFLLERNDWTSEDKVFLLRLVDWAKRITVQRKPTMSVSEYLNMAREVYGDLPYEDLIAKAIFGQIVKVLTIDITVDYSRFSPRQTGDR